MFTHTCPHRRIFLLLAIVPLVFGAFFVSKGKAVSCQDYPLFEFSKVGSLPLEDANTTLALDGSIAYLGGSMPGFKVIDLAEPDNPVLLTNYLFDSYMNSPTWVEPAGDVGFVGGVVGEIPVMDLSDPAAPTEITRFPVLFELKATALNGDFFYAATYGRRSMAGVDTSTFYVMDVSNPAVPATLNIVLDNHTRCYSMECHEGNVYLGASSGLHVLDVTDPLAVTELDQMDLSSPPKAMQFVGDLLHVIDVDGFLHILNATNPAHLVLLSTTDLKVGAVQGLSVQDGMAVIACAGAGIRVVDVSNPANPSVPASWPTTTRCLQALLYGGRVHAINSDEWVVSRDFFPAPIETFSSFFLETWPSRQLLDEHTLYYLDTELHILDVTDPENPLEIATFDDGFIDYSRMTLDGTVLYLGSIGLGGVIALDVSDPATPAFICAVTSEQIYSLHAADGLLAVGPRSGVISLYDVVDPSAPVFLGEHIGVSDYRAYGVALAGDYLYMTTGNTYVLNISDPANIHTVASLDTGFGLDLVADGEWIFTPGDNALTVAKFTPPASLTSIATLDLPEMLYDLHFCAGNLTVACQTGGVHLFDVSTPTNTVRIGAIPALESARCVASNNDIVIVGSSTYPAANDGNIEIFTWPCIMSGVGEPVVASAGQAISLQAYPNPFNPQVTFVFQVPRTGAAKLDIYDLMGRRVTRLVNEAVPSGQNEFDWDGRNSAGRPVASGTYVARLQVGESVVSQRVALVR